MTSLANNLPPIEVLEQLAICCEEIETLLRNPIPDRNQFADPASSQPPYSADKQRTSSFSIEPFVARFPAEFQHLARTEFQKVLEELQASRSSHPQSINNKEPAILQAQQRFEVIEKIAEGGMGQVVVAWDHEFSRKVAIKSIRAKNVQDAALRERIKQEATITALLEHPGILPVYSQGESAQDGPFYAMRLIAGDNTSSLQQAIEELHSENLSKAAFQQSLRKIIRHLIDVCNTIGYAHSQGICHRDLKPSNILIGPFGETFVVDWGLAKIFRSAIHSDIKHTSVSELGITPSDAINSTASSTSQGAGTPGYTAPEVALFDSRIDWPRVDVYSIGSILACIIQGKSPPLKQPQAKKQSKSHSINNILNNEQHSKRARLKKLCAIANKAMEPVPTSRYPSPLRLAADLENYLVGDPIQAIPEGPVEKLFRWASRHRYAVLATTATCLLLLAAIATVAYLQSQHNRELASAAVRLQSAWESEEQHRIQEELLRKHAQEQEKIARDREELAIDALRSYSEVIYQNDALKNSASLLDLRRQLLEKPIQFFEGIANEKLDTEVTSIAYLERIAHITEDLAKLSFEYGEFRQCDEWIAKSIERYSEIENKLTSALPSSDPSLSSLSADDQRMLLRSQLGKANSQRLQGTVRLLAQDALGAATSINLAADIFVHIENSFKNILEGDSEFRNRFLDSRSRLLSLRAIYEAERGDIEKVPEFFQQAIQDNLELIKRITRSTKLDDSQRNTQVQNATQALMHLRQDEAHVNLLKGLGDQNAAFQQFESYISYLKDQIQRNANNESDRLRLAWALHNLGIHRRNNSEPQVSKDRFGESLAMRRELAANFPGVVRYRADLSNTLAELANAYRQCDQNEQAIQYLRESIETLKSLTLQFPEYPYIVELAGRQHSLGHLYTDLEMLSEAKAAFAQALETCSELATKNAALPQSQQDPNLQALHTELLMHQQESSAPTNDL